MVSLSTEYQPHTNLFVYDESLPILIDDNELDNMIQASLSMKKNVLIKNTSAISPEITNLENLIITENYIFIPSRLKKKFTSLSKIKELI